MAVQAHITRMTVDEYEAYIALPENIDRQLQLVDGELIEKMPTLRHSRASHQFAFAIGRYLIENPMGEVLPELRIKLLEGTEFEAYVPDIVFIRHGHAADPDSPLPFMPELIIEIQSPGQSKRVMNKKAEFYLTHGCVMVILAYPIERMVEMITQDDKYFFHAGDMIDFSPVLPGFNLAVDSIFPHESIA
jgi:Uma2 family endonuclease